MAPIVAVQPDVPVGCEPDACRRNAAAEPVVIAARRLLQDLGRGEPLEFENNPVGIKKFLKYAKKCKPTLITCESTGGLEQPLLLACAEAKLPIAVVNPRKVRDFAS